MIRWGLAAAGLAVGVSVWACCVAAGRADRREEEDEWWC